MDKKKSIISETVQAIPGITLAVMKIVQLKVDMTIASTDDDLDLHWPKTMTLTFTDPKRF